jgi:general secretion pathway protein D
MAASFCRVVLTALTLLILAGCETTEGGRDRNMNALLGEVKPPPDRAETSGVTVFGGAQTNTDGGGLQQPIIRYGRAAPLTSDSAAAVPEIAPDGGVTLNFVEAEVRDIARAILGEMMGVSYVVDPAVQGRITLQTSGPISRDDVLGVLQQTLGLNGAALVQRDGVFYVLPSSAAGSVAPVVLGPEGIDSVRGFRIQVLPTNSVDPAQIVEVLRPLIGEGRYVAADSERGLLFIAGTELEVRTAVELARTLDADWFAGMSFGVFPLQRASAGDVAQDINLLVANEGGETARNADIRVVPIERLNAVLVISRTPQNLRRAQSWISAFDRIGETDEEQIFIYYARNSSAMALATTLGQMFGLGGGGGGGAQGSLGGVAPGLDPVAISADGAAPIGNVGTGGSGSGLAPSRASFSGGDGFNVISDPTRNAVIVRTTAKRYKTIERALRELDRAALQVIVEVAIAEVRLNDELRYGVQWFFENGSFTNSLSFGGGLIPAATVPGYSMIFDTADVRVVLDALDEITDVSVLSSPTLLVANNETARLQVGDQVPVAVQSSTSVLDPDAPIVNSIEYRDTGVVLEVMPRVDSGDMVTLTVRQEVSDVVETQTSGIDSPTIQQREIETTVTVRSGQTVALGGLIRDQGSFGRSGVPVLSEIPVVGALFSTRSSTSSRTELIVQLTPRIIANAQDMYEATRQLREQLGNFGPSAGVPPRTTNSQRETEWIRSVAR